RPSSPRLAPPPPHDARARRSRLLLAGSGSGTFCRARIYTGVRPSGKLRRPPSRLAVSFGSDLAPPGGRCSVPGGLVKTEDDYLQEAIPRKSGGSLRVMRVTPSL
ncbi:hypothetical protein EJB05_39371, partial [Eragrostis curvula]